MHTEDRPSYWGVTKAPMHQHGILVQFDRWHDTPCQHNPWCALSEIDGSNPGRAFAKQSLWTCVELRKRVWTKWGDRISGAQPEELYHYYPQDVSPPINFAAIQSTAMVFGQLFSPCSPVFFFVSFVVPESPYQMSVACQTPKEELSWEIQR